MSEDAKTVVVVTHEAAVVVVADSMPGMKDGVVTRHVVVP
jgi:ABC-type lipoprotein export system ATPase subunit